MGAAAPALSWRRRPTLARMAPIDVELCLSGREITEPRLSPDARSVAFTHSADGVAQLSVIDLATGEERAVETAVAPKAGRGMGGGGFAWHPDGRRIVHCGVDGALWWAAVEPGGTSAGPLAVSESGSPLQAPAVSPDGTMVAAVDDMASICVVSAQGGEVRRVDDGGADFVVDPAWSPDGARLAWHAWSVPWMPWDESTIVEVAAAPGTPGRGPAAPRRIGARGVQVQQPRYAPSGALAHLSDRDGWLNVAFDGAPSIVETFEHGGPTWGLGQRSFAISPDGRSVAFARNERGFGRVCVADLTTGETREAGRAVHGSLDWRATTLVALRSGARTPTQLVAYDTTTWERRTLAIGPDARWTAHDLVEPELVEIPAEGGPVHARLYRPHGGSTRLICWVHGGPTDQWQVSFMPRIAYWVSRGWNILVPDHRGSTGHGRAYQQAMAGRWGELDVADVAAAIGHAHRQGWSAPATTVAIGASAGGFSVLGVVARHGGALAGAIVLYPVCDLVELAATSHRFEAHYNDTLVGPSATHAAAWRERSPRRFADRLTSAPLLVMHGDADPVVPLAQSRALVAAITAVGGDASLVVYEGEGHGFRRRENQRDEYARIGRFLDRVVG